MGYSLVEEQFKISFYEIIINTYDRMILIIMELENEKRKT
jgi:hypothetical protein